MHGGFGGSEIGIKVDGGEQGFHGIGEDGGAVVAAAFEFACAEVEGVADVQFAGDFGEGGFFDELGAQGRETAFGELGEGVVEHFGDGVV